MADDIKLNRLFLLRSLEEALPTPVLIEAASGEEALKLLLSGGFDIAILDEHYHYERRAADEQSGITGTEVARCIRAHEQRQAREP